MASSVSAWRWALERCAGAFRRRVQRLGGDRGSGQRLSSGVGSGFAEGVEQKKLIAGVVELKAREE